jgi:hypothetical protein
MPAYALTIFFGAFLLFQVQPLIGKYILPWFGGGPGVWTTCLLFFQVMLVGGYAYAHFVSRWLRPRTQVVVQFLLLATALALLPITPADSWKPSASENPTLQILGLLAACIGLPYLVLSSTGPLMQQWFCRANPGKSPYRLFALSNAGSLLALLSYPFYFESHFTRKTQAVFWGWGLLVYALCCAACGFQFWKAAKTEGNPPNDKANPLDPVPRHSSFPPLPSALVLLLWVLLPACASLLLLATTNKLCQDVAVIPFLWVLPLALYLLSFIICFDSPRWYARLPFTFALIAAMVLICWALFKGNDASMYKQIAAYCGGLFLCCMVCHGELYRLKPDPHHLTSFYLMISIGGALGGIFVAVIAPAIFTNYFELHWGMFLCALLFLVVCVTERVPREENQIAKTASDAPVAPSPAQPANQRTWKWLAGTLPLLLFAGLDWFILRFGREWKGISRSALIWLAVGIWLVPGLPAASWLFRGQFKTFRFWRLLACCWLFLGLTTLGVTLWIQTNDAGSEKIYKSRNFYGVLSVYEHRRTEPDAHHFLLQHGRITHGLQFVDPDQARWPTSYYGQDSGIALAINALPPGPRRIGLVGLGTGTLSAYARTNDSLHIYDINPEVQRLATSRFTYLKLCPAKVEVALGDARLSMEREPPQSFDLLALDAFSSDAIPVHLLTKEAFALYQRHVATNGIIVVHVSNHFLDLEPVVLNLAREFNYKAAVIDYDEDEEEWWIYSCTWIVLTRNEQIINSPTVRRAANTKTADSNKIPLWTDDFASLFQILK